MVKMAEKTSEVENPQANQPTMEGAAAATRDILAKLQQQQQQEQAHEVAQQAIGKAQEHARQHQIFDQNKQRVQIQIKAQEAMGRLKAQLANNNHSPEVREHLERALASCEACLKTAENPHIDISHAEVHFHDVHKHVTHAIRQNKPQNGQHHNHHSLLEIAHCLAPHHHEVHH